MILKLGGKDFELKKLTMNDWIDAEVKGLTIAKMQGLSTNPNALTLTDMRTLIWIAVKSVDPNVTEQWVGEQLDIQSELQEALKIVTNFIALKDTPQEVSTSE